MTLVATVAPESATGPVAAIYAEMIQTIGRVPAAFALYSASPMLLQQQWDFLKHYFHHPTLGGPLLAALRLCVSREFECDYCIGINGGFLVNWFGWTPEQVEALKRDPADNTLDEKDRAMLAFALNTVKSPQAVAASDLDALRSLGWSDGDILEGATHAARNVSADFLLNAFKVERDY